MAYEAKDFCQIHCQSPAPAGQRGARGRIHAGPVERPVEHTHRARSPHGHAAAPLAITPTPTVERLGPSELSPLEPHGTPAPNAMAVTGPSAPAFGALTCSAYVDVKESARTILSRGMEMRQALSPYKDNTLFEEYVAKWDYEAGWDPAKGWSSPVTMTTPYAANLTLTQLVDAADADLQRARDLYAFLLVYAPSRCFTADVSPKKEGLCDRPEDPNPEDPKHTGQVLNPVIDWCNFKARLRQSVRERRTSG